MKTSKKSEGKPQELINDLGNEKAEMANINTQTIDDAIREAERLLDSINALQNRIKQDIKS
ncbi:MAG: hypothetical protein ACPGJS_03140 [Flammeovirgaceae bacterium]